MRKLSIIEMYEKSIYKCEKREEEIYCWYPKYHNVVSKPKTLQRIEI